MTILGRVARRRIYGGSKLWGSNRIGDELDEFRIVRVSHLLPEPLGSRQSEKVCGVPCQDGQRNQGSFPGDQPAILEVDKCEPQELFLGGGHWSGLKIGIPPENSRQLWLMLDFAPEPLVLLVEKELVADPAGVSVALNGDAGKQQAPDDAQALDEGKPIVSQPGNAHSARLPRQKTTPVGPFDQQFKVHRRRCERLTPMLRLQANASSQRRPRRLDGDR